jgi:tetratricopeptide (TPR) repeat protein
LAYYEKQFYEEAIADFSKSLELNPEAPTCYSNRARSYYSVKKFKESAADFNDFLRLAGNSFNNAAQIRKFIKEMGYEPKY